MINLVMCVECDYLDVNSDKKDGKRKYLVCQKIGHKIESEGSGDQYTERKCSHFKCSHPELFI